MQTRQVHQIHMACVSEDAAERATEYDPHLAGDTIHVVSQDGTHVVIQFEDPSWPISVAQSARNDEYVTADEAERIIAQAKEAPSRDLPATRSASWEQKEKAYLALLDLAPQFEIPCRPSGALRDITVSKHRKGPNSPWQWAIHRYGAGMATYAWDGTQWTVVDRTGQMLQHAAWSDPIKAISEAQRLAQADVDRGVTEVERFGD